MAVSKETALRIAFDNAGSFLGTWVSVALKDRNWHISAFSKSDTALVYFVIDGRTAKVTYKNLNTDVKKVPKKFLKILAEETYSVRESGGKTIWKKTS